MRRFGSLIAIGLLAACAPPVPDSGAPAHSDFTAYSDFTTYRVQREAELIGSAPGGSTPPVIPSETASLAGDPTLRAAADALADVPGPDASGAEAEPSREIVLNNPTISDEQDFDAVASRETIQSDAERLKAQRAAYTEIAPTAVPTRNSTGPNVVAYALSTRHAVGTKLHRRGPFGGQARFDRNCGRYASPDLAQEAFLEAGGPERDRLRIDPDGDGYACGWTPTPYRRAAGTGAG